MKRRRNMKFGSRQAVPGAAAVAIACLVGVGLAASATLMSTHASPAANLQSTERPAPVSLMSTAARMAVTPMSGHQLALAVGIAQAASQPGQKPRMAEEVFKNIQVLKGIPVDDFMGTMGIMANALGFCCSDCHTGAGTDTVKWESDDNPKKRTARRMVTMVAAINKENFGGRQGVTCWTCHRGRDMPVVTANLDTVYGTPLIDEDDIVTPGAGMPSVDQVLDKYFQAIGGAQRWAAVTSIVAKGKSVGFEGLGGGGEVEFYAKAPDQRATHIHFPDAPERGDSTRTFNGRTGWIATPLAVVRKYELSGGELDGARLDAQLTFPVQIKQALTNLRVGLPSTVDDKPVLVVQGNGPRGLLGTLYFDRESGLLVRIARLTPSPIGRVSTQVDFANYRDVGGVKMPYRWIFSWLDGRDTIDLTDVQLNSPIDASKFGEPNPLPGK